eukprot:CAMPEP_0196664522 /NCGR_PEP_ID=MMETSP1086-20130531/57508_1 /TAXON_ID=77921 /ORGANISM="Cyanoptyche  gloeocystis , Strain SAG4.97" /LENGTH=50 /DNA_ID=CAMNT_0042000879 /DNA_START=302 /DNA_END=451 /DNA_ORIENTATION=+
MAVATHVLQVAPVLQDDAELVAAQVLQVAARKRPHVKGHMQVAAGEAPPA